MRWLEAKAYIERSPTLLGRAWRLMLVTIAALLGALVGGPVRWVRRQAARYRAHRRRQQIDNEAPRTGYERAVTLWILAGYLRYSKLGEWIANRRQARAERRGGDTSRRR